MKNMIRTANAEKKLQHIFGHKFMIFLKVCLKGNYGMVEVVAAEYVRKCRLIIKDLHFWAFYHALAPA